MAKSKKSARAANVFRSVRQPRTRFIARRSSIHGRGVFALRNIRKGERIVEYAGKHISSREASRREEAAWGKDPHTFLFILNDKIVIDGGVGGNTSRWINHSCAPNCESDDENNRMYIRAIRSIRPGEELTFDYNLVLGERHTAKAKREYPCYCGTRRCRGTLLGPKR